MARAKAPLYAGTVPLNMPSSPRGRSPDDAAVVPAERKAERHQRPQDADQPIEKKFCISMRGRSWRGPCLRRRTPARRHEQDDADAAGPTRCCHCRSQVSESPPSAHRSGVNCVRLFAASTVAGRLRLQAPQPLRIGGRVDANDVSEIAEASRHVEHRESAPPRKVGSQHDERRLSAIPQPERVGDRLLQGVRAN